MVDQIQSANAAPRQRLYRISAYASQTKHSYPASAQPRHGGIAQQQTGAI